MVGLCQLRSFVFVTGKSYKHCQWYSIVLLFAEYNSKKIKKLTLTMTFYQEPTHYEKTILSDLQGAWEVLRDEVIKDHANKDYSRLLLPINEAMSWESVRNLNHMKNTFVLIQSIAQQMNVSDEIIELIEDIRDILYETLSELEHGKIL
jgi:hypothetical protein